MLVCLLLVFHMRYSLSWENRRFVNKYFNENFDDFKNTSIFIRGGDSAGHLVLFIGCDMKHNKGLYTIVFDDKKNEIVSTDTHLMLDSSGLDKTAINRLAVRFMKYNLNCLAVDSNGNVDARTEYSERPVLIRFSDKKYITGAYKDWRKLKGLWYENTNQ